MEGTTERLTEVVGREEMNGSSEFDRLIAKPALFDYSEQDELRLMKLAQSAVKSGMAPKGMNPEACFCAALFGRELGLGFWAAIQNIAVINGRPAVWGDAALAIVQRSGLLVGGVAREELKGAKKEDEITAVCTVQRRGSEEPTTRTFSVAQAKKAGLWGKAGPWQSYPRRMLQLRARAIALRDAFADVLRGIAIGEEVQDIEEAPARGATESIQMDPTSLLEQHDAPAEPVETPLEELETPFDGEPEEAPAEEKPKAASRRSRKAKEQVEDDEREMLASKLDALKADKSIPAADRKGIDIDPRSKAVPLNSVQDAILYLEGCKK